MRRSHFPVPPEEPKDGDVLPPEEPAEERPERGNVVLHCGHFDAPHVDSYAWIKLDPPMDFVRRDQSMGTAQWMATCTQCFCVAGGDTKRMPIRGDGVWQGDELTPRGQG